MISKRQNMAYSTGMMNKRVTVAKRYQDTQETFGKSGQPKYEILDTFWMAETFTKGVKAMHEGALDAYDTVMFRCRYNANIDRWCLLKFHGKWYQITSFNEDYMDNQIQMTAVELANQQVNIVEPTPDPEPTSNAGETDETETDADATGTVAEEGDYIPIGVYDTHGNPVNPEQPNDGTINDNDNDSNS